MTQMPEGIPGHLRHHDASARRSPPPAAKNPATANEADDGCGLWLGALEGIASSKHSCPYPAKWQIAAHKRSSIHRRSRARSVRERLRSVEELYGCLSLIATWARFRVLIWARPTRDLPESSGVSPKPISKTAFQRNSPEMTIKTRVLSEFSRDDQGYLIFERISQR